MASTPLSFSAQFVVGKNFQTTGRSAPSNSVRFGRSVHVSASYATTERSGLQTVSTPSLYDVLGVQMGATCQEIKAAYRRLARISHPDAVSEDSSGEEFMRIHNAYSTLSDPEKRSDYDRMMLWQQRMNRVSPIVMTSSGLRSTGRMPRSWETDQCW